VDPDTRARTETDLDEDLFNFGELYEDDADNPSEEMDVEAFLAAAGGADDDSDGDHSDDDSLGPDVDPSLLALPSSEELERLLRAATEASGGGGDLARTIKRGGIALIAINLLAVGAVLLSRTGSADKLEEAQRTFEQTARELRRDVSQQVDAIRGVTSPTAIVPLALEAEAFDRVRRALDEGDLASARRQLYAALSTADRLPPEERESFEAEAGFLLADTYRIEAERRAAAPEEANR
jgi:hypothetical protein